MFSFAVHFGRVSLSLARLLHERRRIADMKGVANHGIMVMQKLKDACQSTKSFIYREAEMLISQLNVVMSKKGLLQRENSYENTLPPLSPRHRILKQPSYILDDRVSWWWVCDRPFNIDTLRFLSIGMFLLAALMFIMMVRPDSVCHP